MAVMLITQQPGQCLAIGLSSDVKPPAMTNWMFVELDTAKTFVGNGTAWVETMNPAYQPAGGGGGAAWGGITGTLSAQSDLQAALDAKAAVASLGAVAFTNAYADLSGLPSLFNGVYSSLSGIPSTFAPIIGGGATQACAGNDARLSDARTPTQHSINGAQHSFPGGTTTYLRADGTFATPGGGSDPFTAKLVLAGNIATGANTTPVNLTGMSFAYEAASTYVIDIYGIVQAAAATTGHGFGLNCTTAPVLVSLTGNTQLADSGTVTSWSAVANNAIAGVTSGRPGTTINLASNGGGILRTHATTPGTCQFIFRSETTAVTTCMAGTVITIMKVA